MRVSCGLQNFSKVNSLAIVYSRSGLLRNLSRTQDARAHLGRQKFWKVISLPAWQCVLELSRRICEFLPDAIPTATRCNAPAAHCSTPQHAAMYCSTLQLYFEMLYRALERHRAVKIIGLFCRISSLFENCRFLLQNIVSFLHCNTISRSCTGHQSAIAQFRSKGTWIAFGGIWRGRARRPPDSHIVHFAMKIFAW